MKKLLISLGMGLALLGATLFTKTQAQSPFFAPVGQSYEVESKAGTFTDISGLSGTVLINSLGANAGLRGQVFGATAAGGTSPQATAITTAGQSATVNCFPIGFDFPFLGKTMKYFVISSGGGVFFSETGTRAVPCPFSPTGDASTYGVLAIPYSKTASVTSSGILSWKKYTVELGASSAQNENIITPASKSTACYRVDGAAGDRILTVQHDYCITRLKVVSNVSSTPTETTTDEWVFQFKFYERDGSVEFTTQELQQTANSSTTSMTDYKLAIGIMGTNATTAADYIFGINHLYIQPNNNMANGMSVGDGSGNWQNVKPQQYAIGAGPTLTPSNKPETGRTIRIWNARCVAQQHPAVGEDAFVIDVSYPSATSATVKVQYDMTQFASLEELYQAGTIVGVLSDNEEPDFTLQDGTLYLKNHTFPAQNGKAAPTVVFNQMHFVSQATTATDLDTYPCGYKNNASANTSYSTYWLETTVEDLVKGATRYVHLYRMSYVCGTPIYSPLCHTIEIANKYRSVKPDLLTTVGLPTRHTLGLKVKPHEGDNVMVVMTHDLNKVKSIPDEGPLAAGATITEDLVVIGTYSEETTFEVTGLPDDDICYFVAIPVNQTTNEYDNTHTINLRARVAHSGVPFDLDFRLEANGNPWKYIDRTTQQEIYDKTIYRPLPVGWTRTDNLPADRHDLGLGLGTPNFGHTPVAIYGQLEVQGTDADAISTPIYLNVEKIGVTYYLKFQVRGNSSDGDVSETTPKTDDKCFIEYSVGEGDNWSTWAQLASYQGNAFPEKTIWNGGEYYPLAARLTVPNGSAGKYIRFRFRMQTGSGHAAYPQCDYGCIYIMDVYEAPECLTPTDLQRNQNNTTGVSIPLSWSDPNPAANKATAFEISYRKAYTGEDWQSVTVNTANTTLTGLTPSTPYAFKVTAVCPSDKSIATDSAIFNTLYGYAYKETMIEDTGYFYKISGSNVYAKGRGPLERDIKSYTGTLPNSGNASLTIAEDPLSGEKVWATKWGWEKWILFRRCPQSMAVCQSAENAWLVTPVIENTTPRHAQVIRFRASAGWNSSEGSGVANWTLGSVNPSVYGRCTLQVLLSDNGAFTKNDVVGTLNISSYTDLNNKELEIKVPYSKAKTGHVQVALYFQNPDMQEVQQTSSSIIEVSDHMFFEIQDLEYKDDTCPEFEADAELTPSDITAQGAKLTWPQLNVAFYVLNIEPEDGSSEAVTYNFSAEDIQTDEAANCTYTLTDLNDNTAYKVSVLGYCDEEMTMSTNELENTFTTLEACHTPTAFKVEDITYNSASFSSTPAEQKINTLNHRLIYLEDANDASHVHLLKQENNVNPLVAAVHDNRTVTARTRAVCARGDSSAWSAPITFTTPVDPATLPDTFNLVLNVQPVSAGTAGTADGKTRYLEDDEVTMTATANDGYKFVRWQDADGKQLSTNATYKWTATWEGEASDTKTYGIAFTAVFKKQYTITLNTVPTGTTGGTVTGDGTYDEGAEVTLTATPKSAYLFVEWQKDGKQVSTDATYKFIPTENAAYTAVFRAKQYFTLDATVVPNADWGSVSFNPQANDEDKYQEGRVVTMTAVPDQYYKFVEWQDANGETLGTNLTYTVTMDGNKTVKAVFANIQYQVTLVSNPSKDYGTINGTSGQPSDGGTFNAGTTRKLEAKPKPGYVFVKWMSGTKELGANAKLEFILTQDTTITAYFAEKDPLVITVNVDPANAGTVTGAGNVKRGEQAVLTATPAAHYAFKEWKRLDGSTISSNPYKFTPLRDYTFTATFRALENYTVTVESTEGGTVTGGGTYEEGQKVTVTATANEHYAFTEWQDADGETVSSDETYEFTATGNTTVKAVFTPLSKYTVTLLRYVNGNPTPAAGTLTGAGTYDDGTEVTITATANKGYRFLAWQKADGTTVSTDNPYTFNITASATYRAVYEEIIKIAVTVDPEGAGTVTGAGMYDENDEVTLSIASVDDDYVFEAWLDADGAELNTETPYTFTATVSQNITAKFREKEYFDIDVTLLGSAEDEDDLGSVSIPGGDEGKYQEGKTITMTATPNRYCKFVEWRDSEGNKLSEETTYTFVISQDMEFQAVFAHIQYTVTLKSDPSTEYGTINGTTGSTTTGGTFNAGTTRKLEAKPKTGYEFVKWMSGTKELGTAAKLEFVLTQDTTITAYFKAKEDLTITLSVEPANAGTVTGAGTVKRGNDAVLTATANAAYKFLYWVNLAGDEIEDNPYTLVKPQRDYTFKAVFRAKYEYEIMVTRVPNATAGTIEKKGFLANGKAREDATVSLTAKPAEGYTFTEWQDADGKQVSTEATLTLTATANVTYKAVFAEIPTAEYTVTLLRDPVEGGRISGDGTYEEGTEASITATPNAHYTFDGWYNGTAKISAEATYKFMVTADVTYTAKFTRRPTVDVDITVRLGETVDATVGTVTGAGEYEIGKTVTLTATPASEDYLFSGWRDLDNDDELIGSANPFTFTASKNVRYAAVFREKFEVTLNILPDENAGTVTGDGPGRQGYPRTITAEPAEGYKFLGWYDETGNTVITTETSHTFTLEGNVTFTAKFEVENENEVNITVKRMPGNEAGTVKGNGRYEIGEKATLTATPATNYLFVGWLKPKADDNTKFDTVKNNPYSFTVEGDAAFIALFRTRARYMIEVDVLPNDNAGTVTGDGEVREGRTVTLTAEPATGYTFVAWVNPALTAPKDTVSRSATYAFSATGNATYKAIFKRAAASYTVTLNTTPANAGTVEGDGTYREGQTVTLNAKPHAGYRFAGWRSANGTTVSKEPTYQFQITKNMTFTAVFQKKDIMTVTLNVTPENAGTVTGGGEYPIDAEALITATANKGYVFVEWLDENGETVSQDAKHRFTVVTDVTYTAVFEKGQTVDPVFYNITLETLPNHEAGTVTGAGRYEEGSMVTVTATANDGYTFVQWQDADGNALHSEATYAFEATADVTYAALFKKTSIEGKPTVTISLKALPSSAAGTLKGAGKYEKGKQVTIEAIPATNYTFVAWLGAKGDTVSKKATYTFTAETDASYSALFQPLTANEQELKAAFNVAAGNGQLFIDNLNGVVVREVTVFNTVGHQLAHFTPNSNLNLALPVDARYTVLVVRVVSEQGMAIYKVYLH